MKPGRFPVAAAIRLPLAPGLPARALESSLSHVRGAPRASRDTPPRRPRPLAALLCLLALLLPSTGCRIVQGVADAPGQAVRAVIPAKDGLSAVDPVEIQQALLRFTDEYSQRMISGVDKLQRGTNALSRAEVLLAKTAIGTETCAIASGPNAIADLLDMVVFVTVTRMAIEDYWQPTVFGESAQPLLDYSWSAETEIWRLAAKVLTPEQQAELRAAITDWHRQNSLPDSLVATRSLGFASRVKAASKDAGAQSASVFRLLNVDPLAGMDPAVREIAQTRLFAERALFVAQKLPVLIRWQTELLSQNAFANPAVQQLVTNATQITATLERFADIAEQLPAHVSAERAEILKALQAQEQDVAALMASGTRMSDSLNTTLTTFDALMQRFGVGETNAAAPPATNAEPFRIQDYTATAKQLTDLLVALDRTIAPTNLAALSNQVATVVQQAGAGGRDVVDYAFWKGVLLILLVPLAALIYRLIATRLFSSPKKLDTHS